MISLSKCYNITWFVDKNSIVYIEVFCRTRNARWYSCCINQTISLCPIIIRCLELLLFVRPHCLRDSKLFKNFVIIAIVYCYPLTHQYYPSSDFFSEYLCTTINHNFLIIVQVCQYLINDFLVGWFRINKHLSDTLHLVSILKGGCIRDPSYILN